MILKAVRRHGFSGVARKTWRLVQRKSGWLSWRTRHAPRYRAPTAEELDLIERGLESLGVHVHDYFPSPEAFYGFQHAGLFPPHYHGGKSSGVWDEKLLEHWVSSQILGLDGYTPGEIYVDIAAAGSPWAHILRENRNICAYAIDLELSREFCHLPYYRREDATCTGFDDGSVKGISLHCAYEMFMGETDTRFIYEAARILRPGGKAVILPLYMHTHYCSYSTPEYYGRGFSDAGAKEYVRMDCYGVPSSRKYDPCMLKQRVLDPIEKSGMAFRLLALRNKEQMGQNIYCHFILEITR